jgi:hypothetical protein
MTKVAINAEKTKKSNKKEPHAFAVTEKNRTFAAAITS